MSNGGSSFRGRLTAGLVSLGLQVGGGIKKYLDALDCRDQDIASVRQQNHALAATFRVIESSQVLPQLQPKHQESTAAVQGCLDSCRAELNSLDRLVTDLAGSSTSTTVGRRDRIKARGKKALYPFNRPKLEELGKRLHSANASLKLSLQMLNM